MVFKSTNIRVYVTLIFNLAGAQCLYELEVTGVGIWTGIGSGHGQRLRGGLCRLLHHRDADDSLKQGVNFTNILHAAFTLKDLKSAKKTVKSNNFLRFWDLFGIKAAPKHVDEIDP